MREITPDSFTVYKLEELEPGAREKAIEAVAEKLGGDWWDQSDVEVVSETIAYALARALGTPGVDQRGEGDFPGIDGVRLDGWDLNRGSYLTLRGTLTRENAPGLPWADGVVEVSLTTRRDYTEIDVRWDEDHRDPNQERDLTVVREECKELAALVEAAVEEAMQVAMTVGRTQMEYIGSAEAAIENIGANEREFYADGTLYT